MFDKVIILTILGNGNGQNDKNKCKQTDSKYTRKTLDLLKVLSILDDVNRLDQVEALVGKVEEQPNWLGPGSRVIVITDKLLLEGEIWGTRHT